MKDIAFVFLPTGIVLTILLLSGVAMLQSMAISFQKKSIKFQVFSKKIDVSTCTIIFYYTFIRFLFTILELNKYSNDKVNFENINSLNLNRSYLKKMRLQRNFWILLLCSITWLFLIRFSHLLKYYRDKVKEIDEKHEKIKNENKKKQEKIKEEDSKEEIAEEKKKEDSTSETEIGSSLLSSKKTNKELRQRH